MTLFKEDNSVVGYQGKWAYEDESETIVTYEDESETIVTDPNTGGQKATKPSQIGLVDPVALTELGNVAGMGADKYQKWNYLKGYDWSLSFNAMQRHALEFWGGEELDRESGYQHMAHASWHCLALVSFVKRGLGTDDRFTQ